MATTKDKAMLQDIEENRKVETMLGTKKIKIRRTCKCSSKKV